MSHAPAPLRFGLIGVDSPHAPSFTRLLGDGVGGSVPGAVVAAAWPGVAADDFPLARDRIGDFARQVRELGVPMLESPEAVADECDAVLVVASDVRTHRGYLERVARFGKPVYVDTRFALTTGDARAMLDALDRGGSLPLAGSPKRFTPQVRAAVGGRVTHAELRGPLPTQPGHPVLDWYGFHLVDLAVAAMGHGVVNVDASEAAAPVRLTWHDGRTADLSAGADPTITSGVLNAVDGDHGFQIVSGEPMLVGLLAALVDSCRTRTLTVPREEILDVVAVVEAARASRAAGRPVSPA